MKGMKFSRGNFPPRRALVWLTFERHVGSSTAVALIVDHVTLVFHDFPDHVPDEPANQRDDDLHDGQDQHQDAEHEVEDHLRMTRIEASNQGPVPRSPISLIVDFPASWFLNMRRILYQMPELQCWTQNDRSLAVLRLNSCSLLDHKSRWHISLIPD